LSGGRGSECRNPDWQRFNALTDLRYWAIWSDKKEMKVKQQGKYLTAYINGKWHYLTWSSGHVDLDGKRDKYAVWYPGQNGPGVTYSNNNLQMGSWYISFLKSPTFTLKKSGSPGYAAIFDNDNAKALSISRVGPCKVDHTCPSNGKPVYGNCWSKPESIKTTNSNPSCGYCNIGFHLTGYVGFGGVRKQECVSNTCKCPNGTPMADTKGYACHNNASLCKACDSGFKRSKDKTKCTPFCLCPGGTPSPDSACAPNPGGGTRTLYSCSGCDANYDYNNNKCQPKITDEIISYWKKPTTSTSFRSASHKQPNVNRFYLPGSHINDSICETGLVPLEDYNWKYTSQQSGCKHKGICTYYNKSAYSGNNKPGGTGEAVLEPVPENADTCIKDDGTRTSGGGGCKICGV